MATGTMNTAMARITSINRAIGNPLTSLQLKYQAANDLLSGCSGRGIFWGPNRRHHRHHQLQRSFLSTNVSCTEISAAILSTARANKPCSFLVRNHLIPRSRTGRRCSLSSQSSADALSPPQNTLSSQQKESLEKRPKSDPTAKRPTQKCDPYGLQGESLPYAQCRDWMSTLEDGWVLLKSENSRATDNLDDYADATNTDIQPKFLQKQFYHATFHEASQFLSHISLLATNLNHFPFLSMERILVDDINNIHGDEDSGNKNNGSDTKIKSIDTDGRSSNAASEKSPKSKRKGRKIKGWVFCSTIRCSTYRPPIAGGARSRSSQQNEDKVDLHGDQGLTYHDFHLAMSIDIEANREEVKRLLWSDC